ncbi:beta-lactamase family protein [Brenneria sp. 4F2]|nr:beta-lactamase family protein [Brenneria bubanii]
MMLNWKRAAEVAQSITESWDCDRQPGGAIVLFDREQIQAASCGGLADLAQGTPFSTSSVVRFASVTKHLFAAMVTGPMSGNIALTDKLAQHLPQLTGPNGQVTVGQALDMTSGLDDIRETLSLLGLSVYNATQAADLLQFEADMGELNYPAGSEISYSNTGYRLVEEALRAKGILFADLLQQHVCAPLNIHLHAPDTWFDIVPGLVPGYWHGKNGWQLASAGLHLSASGSVAGSVRDLSVWLQTLLRDDGPGAGVLERLSAPRRLADGRVTGYGMGIAHTRLGAAHWVGHGGSHAGYKTYFLLDPQQGVGVALVANREDVATYDCALRIMAALQALPLPQPGHALTAGLYASDSGGDWLEISGNTACWLGAGDTLYPGEDPAEAVSLSSHMPMRLRQNGAAIEGEIGHVPRRFLPVAADDGIELAQGRWFCPQWRSELTIAGDELVMGIGPAAITASLISLGKGRLLATAQDGPWEKRFAIQLEGDEMRLLLNRSRIVRYQR